MSALRDAKDVSIKALKSELDKSVGALFLDYTGLTVHEVTKLRAKVREQQLSYRVVKNTLLSRAVSGTPYESAKNCLKGTPTGVLFGYADPVTMAKTLYAFTETCEHIKVKGGILDNKAISEKDAKALSKLPSKAELQGQVIAAALSPGRKLAGQLKSPAGKIVGAIEALAKRLEGSAS